MNQYVILTRDQFAALDDAMQSHYTTARWAFDGLSVILSVREEDADALMKLGTLQTVEEIEAALKTERSRWVGKSLIPDATP